MDLTIAANTSVAPPAIPTTGTPGYFSPGNPTAGVPATTIPAYQLHALVQEIVNVIVYAGETPDRTNNTQLQNAIQSLIATETTRAEGAETALGTLISNETTRATSAETALGNRVTTETTRATGAETALGTRITNLFSTVNDHTGVGDRVLGTTYTNSTGRPMSLSVVGRSDPTSGANANLIITVNSTVKLAEFGYTGNGVEGFVTGMIPNGATYVVSTNVATVGVTSWVEIY